MDINQSVAYLIHCYSEISQKEIYTQSVNTLIFSSFSPVIHHTLVQDSEWDFGQHGLQ